MSSYWLRGQSERAYGFFGARYQSKQEFGRGIKETAYNFLGLYQIAVLWFESRAKHPPTMGIFDVADFMRTGCSRRSSSHYVLKHCAQMSA